MDDVHAERFISHFYTALVSSHEHMDLCASCRKTPANVSNGVKVNEIYQNIEQQKEARPDSSTGESLCRMCGQGFEIRPLDSIEALQVAALQHIYDGNHEHPQRWACYVARGLGVDIHGPIV